MGSRKLERTSEGTGSLATHLLQLQVQLVHDERCTANHSCAGKKKNRRHTFEARCKSSLGGVSWQLGFKTQDQHKIHPVLEENN